MNIWSNAIARAGGIEAAPGTGSNPAGPSTAHGNRPTLARRVLADIGGGASLQALEGRVSRLGQALSVWRRRRAAVRELSVLSDHMLKDIGLHRSEIRSVVEELLGSESPSRVKTTRPADLWLARIAVKTLRRDQREAIAAAAE